MTRNQWLASAAIIFHLAALSTAAVPDPDLLNDVGGVRHPTRNMSARILTPALDAAGQELKELVPIVHRAVAPMRPLSAAYTAAGLGNQRWNMFANPEPFDQYVRLDSWIAGDDGRTPRVVREIVLPADEERQIRTFHRYRDKAIINSLEKADAVMYALQRRPDGDDVSRLEAEAIGALAPIVEWSRRRVEKMLEPGERVHRVEFWRGRANTTAPGTAATDEHVDARFSLIEPYHHGPRPVPNYAPRAIGVGGTEQEADVTWRLVYVGRP